MPPKSAQKPKAEPAKAAPEKDTPKKTPQDKDTPKKPSKPRKPATDPSPKKPKEPTIYKTLQHDANALMPVDILYEGESIESKIRKTGDYGHIIKLTAPNAFTLVRSTILTDGPYKGMQAILLQPAKPFPFLKLPKEARSRVYSFYLAPSGVTNEEIVLDGKRRNDTKDVYAKTYCDGDKNRVALLAVNKEVYSETVSVLYNHVLRVENTTALLDFLGQIETSTRGRLAKITINQYVKTTSRNAMHFLAESSNLQRLRIEKGVFSEGDPAKGAKSFYGDAYKFLEAVGAAKGDKGAGVDVLSFGKEALTFKGDGGKVKPWADTLVEEFKDNLRGKLK